MEVEITPLAIHLWL